MLNADVSFLFMRAAYHFAIIFLFFAINLALASVFQRETSGLFDKT